MSKKRLNLYVWESVFVAYYDGIAFAYAENVEEARKLVIEKMGYDHIDLYSEPQLITGRAAFYVVGAD